LLLVVVVVDGKTILLGLVEEEGLVEYGMPLVILFQREHMLL